MPLYRLDLHVHSPASSCFYGGDEAYEGIIAEARKKRLDMIAVTDHHSAGGFEKLKTAALKTGIVVLPGVELTCRVGSIDEVFILAVFGPRFSAGEIDKMLSDLAVPLKEYGHGSFVLTKDVGTVIETIKRYGGLVVSSRTDKTEYRAKALPELLKLGVSIYDVVHPEEIEKVFGGFEEYRAGKLTFFTFSDSHEADNTGRRFSELELPSLGYEQFVEKVTKNC